jgi:hypothetical protein
MNHLQVANEMMDRATIDDIKKELRKAHRSDPICPTCKQRTSGTYASALRDVHQRYDNPMIIQATLELEREDLEP